MSKLSLNFFGEKVEIKIPETIEKLRKEISEKYSFSKEEVKGIIVYYLQDFKRKVIETEEDLRQMISKKIKEVLLDVDEGSMLFKKEEEKVEKEEKIEKLKKAIQEKEEEFNEKKKKIQQEKILLKQQCMQLKKKIVAKKSEIIKLHQEQSKTINQLTTELNELQGKKIFKFEIPKIPIKFKNPLKFLKKAMPKFEMPKVEMPKTILNGFEYQLKKDSDNKVVHWNVICDGCGAKPITGIRYKCAVCKNFDYCEKCEAEKTNSHQHPFIKITSPKFNPSVIRCFVPENYPLYHEH